jgi:hypothetical protein
MADESETALADAEADADFASGFPAAKVEKPPAAAAAAAAAATPPAKPDAPRPAATPRAAVIPPPEYVQITKADWDEMRVAATKTNSHEGQLSKAFGTLGKLQQLVTSLHTQTATGRKVEIPKDAFAAMERDFPELAQQTRAALEAALSGMPGSGGAAAEPDLTGVEKLMATYTAKREVEALEDAYPEWRKIVGAVDVTREQPDKNNPFRKWLGTKDAAYQNRINSSESAQIIGRAIRLFQFETKAGPAKPAPSPRDVARADRIRGAVQPRGDNAGTPAGKSDDDEFLAGFSSR